MYALFWSGQLPCKFKSYLLVNQKFWWRACISCYDQHLFHTSLWLGSWWHKGAGRFWAKTSIWNPGYQACNTLVLNVMEKEYFQHITGSCHKVSLQNDEQSIWAGIEVLFGIFSLWQLSEETIQRWPKSAMIPWTGGEQDLPEYQ